MKLFKGDIMKKLLIQIKEETYNQLKTIKEIQGIPIVVSIRKAIEAWIGKTND